jgi:hypothetical protein
MTLYELKAKYNRLSQEIDALAGSGECEQARLMRLMNELDRVHDDLAALRRRTLAAPVLRDVVAWGQASVGMRAVPQAA